MEDVVDECNARLDSIGPILGGSGARDVCGRDKSFDPRSRVEWPSATPPVKLGKLTLHCRCSFRGKKQAGRWTMALSTPTKAIGYPTDSRAENHRSVKSNNRCFIYTKCASVTSCSASHSKGIIYYLAGSKLFQIR